MTRVVHKGIYASDILAQNFTRRVDDHFCTQPTADLWTRATLNWTILDDAGGTDTVTLTGLVGEAVTF